MEARLAALNLSHYTATLQAHEIDDDILKLMTVAEGNLNAEGSIG